MVVTRLPAGAAVPGEDGHGRGHGQGHGKGKGKDRAEAEAEVEAPVEAHVGEVDAVEGDPAPSKKQKKSKGKKKEKAGGAGGAGDAGTEPAKRVKRQPPAPTPEQAAAIAEAALRRKKRKRKEKGPELADGALAWLRHLYESDGEGLSKIELYPSPLTAADVVEEQVGMDELLGKLGKGKQGLVLCASALRACELLKPMAKLRRPIAKLFAKHMKLAEQQEFIRGRSVLGVGTPNRVLKLAETGCLETLLADKTALLVFDLQPNVKNFSVLTLDTVSADCFALLREWLKLPPGGRARLAFLRADGQAKTTKKAKQERWERKRAEAESS